MDRYIWLDVHASSWTPGARLGKSARQRFGGILSEEPAQVNWRALATVKAASPGLDPR